MIHLFVRFISFATIVDIENENPLWKSIEVLKVKPWKQTMFYIATIHLFSSSFDVIQYYIWTQPLRNYPTESE